MHIYLVQALSCTFRSSGLIRVILWHCITYCAAVGGPSIIVVASLQHSRHPPSLARINRGRNISHIVLLQPMINTHATPNAMHATRATRPRCNNANFDSEFYRWMTTIQRGNVFVEYVWDHYNGNSSSMTLRETKNKCLSRYWFCQGRRSKSDARGDSILSGSWNLEAVASALTVSWKHQDDE